MYEPSTTLRTRDAIDAGRKARSDAFAAFLERIFHSQRA